MEAQVGGNFYGNGGGTGGNDIGVDTALDEAQVRGCFYSDEGGRGGYEVGAETALEADVGADTALVAQGGGRFFGDGGGPGVHDSPLAPIQCGGGPRTLDGLFINSDTWRPMSAWILLRRHMAVFVFTATGVAREGVTDPQRGCSVNVGRTPLIAFLLMTAGCSTSPLL